MPLSKKKGGTWRKESDLSYGGEKRKPSKTCTIRSNNKGLGSEIHLTRGVPGWKGDEIFKIQKAPLTITAARVAAVASVD